MFGPLTTPDLPHQLYGELVQRRAQERLSHRIARERKATRISARRQARRSAPWRWVSRPEAEVTSAAVR